MPPDADLTTNRRRLLTAGGALVVAASLSPAGAQAADANRWLAYEGRLRRLLGDARHADIPAVSAPLTELTNRFRKRHGLRPLANHPGLRLAARAHAADLAARRYFAHDTPEGFTPNDRVGLLARRLCGVSGENLSYRQGGGRLPTAAELLEGWIKSPGHRANLLRPEYDRVGHAAVRAGARTYAAAVFGGEAAQLASDLPLTLPGAKALSPALAGALPAMDRFEVSLPQDDTTEGPWPVQSPPDLGAGAWRLRPLLPQGGGRFTILWGPIFVIA